jgi:anaerobic selenocysteine-containing dehydrogenase
MQTEHLDIHDSYSHLYLQWNNPAAPPRGQALAHTEIFRRLATAMGRTEPELCATDDELAAALLDTDHPNLAGITSRQLSADGFARLNRPQPDLPFAARFPTPSGRFEFRSERADRDGHSAFPHYTPPAEAADTSNGRLALLATASHHQLNSTFANSNLHDQHPLTVTIHPDDATRLGLTADRPVTVSNQHGSFIAELAVSIATRPGVAATNKGNWAGDHAGINAVTAEADADMGRGATYHDNHVTLSQPALARRLRRRDQLALSQLGAPRS